MSFIKTTWVYARPDRPVRLYSELDEDRWEVRKVNVYSDGHCAYADEHNEVGGVMLSDQPFLPLSELSDTQELRTIEISSEEFEHIWADWDGIIEIV